MKGATNGPRTGLIPAHAGSTSGCSGAPTSRRAHPRSRGEHRRKGRHRNPRRGSSPLTRGARATQGGPEAYSGLIPAHAGSTPGVSSTSSRRRAHPRSRGEHFLGVNSNYREWGSSPLTRGAPLLSALDHGDLRLIPAHAGSTQSIGSSPRFSRAHPRSRGEHSAATSASRTLPGSSPLTRGAPGTSPRFVTVTGLIPAHAGSTPINLPHACPSWAHPRSRGEHGAIAARGGYFGGSSPLTRGAQARVGQSAGNGGLIPAHAGSTFRISSGSRPVRAHPRSRGEHRCEGHQDPDSKGSSPLTRGAPPGRPEISHGGGLIPAHAGSTRRSSRFSRATTAHPRSRGEHDEVDTLIYDEAGSSPLTRGAPELGGRGRGWGGLIPAHAGSTRLRRCGLRRQRAHPRSRGEHSFQIVSGLFDQGSSPLTRGAPISPNLPTKLIGLIPAHAGSTPRSQTGAWCTRAHPRSRGEHSKQRSACASSCGSSPLTRGAPCRLRAGRGRQRLIPAHAGSTGLAPSSSSTV